MYSITFIRLFIRFHFLFLVNMCDAPPPNPRKLPKSIKVCMSRANSEESEGAKTQPLTRLTPSFLKPPNTTAFMKSCQALI